MAAGLIVCGLGFALEHIFEAFKKLIWATVRG